MSKWKARIATAACLLVGSVATGVALAPPAPAAPTCYGPITTPCVVVNGLVIEPVITSFPSYPTIPVNFALAPDGKIFVADKSGRVLLYTERGDSSPDVIFDIRGDVHDYWDRGLLGIAVDPQYGSGSNYLYILYTYDEDPRTGAGPPRWGSAAGGDGCPSPPVGGGINGDGCLVGARLSRLPINPATGQLNGAEDLLFESNSARGVCSQFPSHTIGTLIFGADGKLYAGIGDGASFDQPDWGQLGGRQAGTPVPANACGDPPSARGTALSEPTAEGGALRSQSVRSTNNDGYQPLDGSIIRLNKDGTVPTDNPLYGGSDGHGDDDLIVAYGMRNAYRFNFRPGTNELWLGDVGSYLREEISRAPLNNGTVPNFGWPCRQGNLPDYEFTENRDFNLCPDGLGTVTIPGSTVQSPLVWPVVSYGHSGPYWDLNVDDGGCKAVSSNSPGSAVVGGAFVTATDWPNALNGAYVYGDYARQCLWAVTATQQYSGADPEILAHQLTPIASKLAPVAIQTGPDGSIYVLDVGDSNTSRSPGIWRIGTLSSPIARFTMTPSPAPPGQAVRFDATSSYVRPGASIVQYAWDFDGDGSFETIAGAVPADRTYPAGSHTIGLRVTDSTNLTNSTTQVLQVGTPPVINGITTSIGSAGHLEGESISFDVDATGASALAYTVSGRFRHCDTPGGAGCHDHFNVLGNVPTAADGRGAFVAPGHVGYSYVQLVVTATDAAGLATTRTFDLAANWLTMRVDTFPPGLNVARDGSSTAAPYASSQIGTATTTISTPTVQVRNGLTHFFTGWADEPDAAASRTFAPAAGNVDVIAQFAAADGLTSIAPTRVLDTRVGTGAPAAIVPSQGTVQLDLRAAGMPATATAVLLNVTTTEGTADGFVTAYPCSQPRPLASNLNYTAGQTVANLVQVAIDGGGQLCLYAHGATHLVADLSGWFEPTGRPFTPASPRRVLDTRVGTGAPVGALGAQQALELDLSSVVAAGGTSVVLNVTSTESAADGFVTAHPCGGERPLASNLNVRAGDTRPNQVVVALGAGGKVCLYAHSTMHLVADLLGWYGATGVEVATQAPERVLDTRTGVGGSTRLGAGGIVELDLSAQAPPGASGVVLNVTGVSPSTFSYVTAYPCGVERPLASNLNLSPQDIRPNLVTVPLGAGGKVCIFSQAPIDLVADVAGWAVDVA